jgi:hypothetical protein
MNNVYSAPENEGGADAVIPDSGVADTGGGVDSGDTGETGGEPAAPDQRLSVRDEIKKAMADSSQQEQQKSKKLATGGKGVAPPVDPTQQQQQTPQQTVPAPERLSKEAKADWDKAPETVKQAFVKAEQDMQRGVEELRQRYAGIDQAIAPHADALRQMNASPADRQPHVPVVQGTGWFPTRPSQLWPNPWV